ncbi:MAG TPA: dihydrofolate reductase family protein [Mucilaginibacter sp.]|nr:dihydrofolate reductase family protein [Mucilaginibacter sp.]
MKKIIVSNMISADGLFAGPGGDLSAFRMDNGLFSPMVGLFDRVDTILLGRQTYQFFAAYWPNQTRETDPAADLMNQAAKVVYTNTLEKAPWGEYKEATIIKGDIAGSVKKLKEGPGEDIVVFGSGQLTSALAEADLVDEYRFILNPVILGKGQSMFEQLTAKRPLKLTAVTTLNTGIIFLDYERDRS